MSRERKIEELRGAGLQGPAGRTVSIDANLWCREFESGALDDPEHHPVPGHLYQWTAGPASPDDDAAAAAAAETVREKMHLEQVWVREALEGRWFEDLRAASQAFIEACTAQLTGTVTWRLGAGSAETLSIVAESPRYIRSREEWEHHSIDRELPVAPVS